MGCMVVIFAAGSVLLMATFVPNALKPVIQQWVSHSLQRTVIIEGNIEFVFYPQAAARLRGLSVSEYQQDELFASIDEVVISLSLFPLFKKQLIIDRIEIHGLDAKLIRYRDGRLNINDLLMEDDRPSMFTVEIAQINVVGNELAFWNERSEKSLVLTELDLAVEQLTSASIQQINMHSRFSGWGIENNNTFETHLKMGQINLSAEKYTINSVFWDIHRNEPGRRVAANMAISDLIKSNSRLNSEWVHLRLDVKQNARTVHATLDTALAVQLDEQLWILPNIKTTFNFFDPEYTNKQIRGYFAGQVDLNLQSEMLQSQLQGQVDGNATDMEISIHNFSEPAYSVKVMIDELDLSPFLSERALEAGGKEQSVSLPSTAEFPNLSFLDNVLLNGSVYIGHLTVGDTRSSGLKMTFELGQSGSDAN